MGFFRSVGARLMFHRMFVETGEDDEPYRGIGNLIRKEYSNFLLILCKGINLSDKD